MRRIATIFALSAAFASSTLVGCSADIHGNSVVVDAKVSIAVNADVDVNAITPGQAVPVTLKADGAFLVDPKETPPAAHVDDAVYFKVFLDDTTTTALAVTASTSVSVTIPQMTPEGKHKLLCHLYKHDGTDANQEQSVDINVKASASATTSTMNGTTTTTGSASGSATITTKDGG